MDKDSKAITHLYCEGVVLNEGLRDFVKTVYRKIPGLGPGDAGIVFRGRALKYLMNQKEFFDYFKSVSRNLENIFDRYKIRQGSLNATQQMALKNELETYINSVKSSDIWKNSDVGILTDTLEDVMKEGTNLSYNRLVNQVDEYFNNTKKELSAMLNKLPEDETKRLFELPSMGQSKAMFNRIAPVWSNLVRTVGTWVIAYIVVIDLIPAIIMAVKTGRSVIETASGTLSWIKWGFDLLNSTLGFDDNTQQQQSQVPAGQGEQPVTTGGFGQPTGG